MYESELEDLGQHLVQIQNTMERWALVYFFMF